MQYVLFRNEYKRLFEKQLNRYFKNYDKRVMEYALNIVLSSYWNTKFLLFEIESNILESNTIKEVYKLKTEDEKILQYRHKLSIMNKEIFKDIKELFIMEVKR